MDGLMGMEQANRTTVKAFPRTPKHEKAALAATESIRFCLQNNFYDETRSQAFDNLLNECAAGVEVVWDKKKDDISIRHILFDRLIWDPLSRRKDFSDARYLGQFVVMDMDEAQALYPDAKEILDDTIGAKDERWYDAKRERVKIVELYWHEGEDVKYACFTKGGYLKGSRVSPYKNEIGETEWPYEFASLFVGANGFRYGASYQLLGVQDEINKRRSKALHLMSVRQTFGAAGAVPDINKARNELAKPDGHLEVAHGEFGKDFGILPTGDMAQAQFKLLEESKAEMDAVSYSAAAAGKDIRNMSGVALRSREAASQTELAPVFNVLKHLDIRVYRKVWNRIRQYWTDNMFIRVTDEERNLKWVGLNKPTTKGALLLERAQEQGLPPEALQKIQLQIQQNPKEFEQQVIDNEIADLDVDLILDDAPDSVSTQIEDFQVIGEMVKSGFPMPPEAVIEASPLNNKDKILKMMKEAPQVPPQIQKQMQEVQDQLKKMQEEGQKLQQENQQLKLAAHDKSQKSQIDREDAMAMLQLKRDIATAEIEIKREQADKGAELERYKAELEMATPSEVTTKDGKKTQASPVITRIINDSLVGPLMGIQEALQQLVQLQTETLSVLQRPKQISLSDIERDAKGRPVGAVVTPTLQ
jgi:hypothetical protein